MEWELPHRLGVFSRNLFSVQFIGRSARNVVIWGIFGYRKAAVGDMQHATSFWTFSLKFYSQPAVGDACLDLQDRFGADVNIVLYGLWQAHRGRRLSESDIRKVIELVGVWQKNVVWPLRMVRRFLKAPLQGWPSQGIDLLHQHVKAEELQAEHLQQSAMETAFTNLGEPDDAATVAVCNLKAYAYILGVEFPSAHLATLSGGPVSTL
jgi:uncharacterized protein (TIGR02444 family)